MAYANGKMNGSTNYSASYSNYVEINETIKSTVNGDIAANNFAEFICQKLEGVYHERVVLVDGITGREWTGHGLKNAILILSSQLISKVGLVRGDRVFFHCPNSDLHAIALFAVLAAGGVYTGCGYLHAYREVLNTVEDAEATILVGRADNIKVIEQVREECSNVRKVLTLYQELEGYLSFEVLLFGAGDPRKGHFEEITPTSIAAIHFSSGTSSRPKPAIRTHGNFNAMIGNVNQRLGHWFPSGAVSTVGCASPFVHGAGLSLLMLSLGRGLKAIVLPSYGTADSFCEYVQRYKINSAMLVTSQVIVLNLFEDGSKFDLTSLTDVVVTGSKAHLEISRQFIERYKPKMYRLLYGSTETLWVSIVPAPLASEPFDLKSIGLPWPGTEIKIIDLKTGQRLGPEESGEIVVRGAQVSPGYLNNPKTNSTAFTEDGFFRTGDCGHFDTTGRLYIEDSYKEIIRSEGQLVSPTELESVILTHNAVADVVVLGFPHELFVEAPRAFVVLKDGQFVTEVEIVEHVAAHVVSWKRLRNGVRFMNDLPRTILGKPDKKVLRSLD